MSDGYLCSDGEDSDDGRRDKGGNHLCSLNTYSLLGIVIAASLY